MSKGAKKRTLDEMQENEVVDGANPDDNDDEDAEDEKQEQPEATAEAGGDQGDQQDDDEDDEGMEDEQDNGQAADGDDQDMADDQDNKEEWTETQLRVCEAYRELLGYKNVEQILKFARDKTNVFNLKIF